MTTEPMDEVAQSLEEWTGPDLPEGPISEEIAALMMRRLSSLTRKVKRREAVALAVLEAARAEAAEWLEAETSSAREQAAQLEARLREWGLDVRDAYGRKSVTFPHGKVATRESGGSWEVVDEAALMEWAQATHPELVVVKTTFRREDAKRGASGLVATEDGEVMDAATSELVPGIKVSPRVVTASVTVGGES